MERFVPVEGFDTNGSRNRGIPREETAGGLAPALRGEKWGRKRKGLGREPRRAALVTSMIGEYRVISKRNKKKKRTLPHSQTVKRKRAS
jgi:hypothetical protein